MWPDGYYTTFNIFNGNTFGGAKLCAYDRTAMLSGAPATQQCFQLSTSFGGVLPSDLDGATAPPAGSPNYMLNFGTQLAEPVEVPCRLGDTGEHDASTGPTNIPVAAFTPACGGGTCIPQSGVNQKLDSLADRLMYPSRLSQFHGTGAHESLVVTHSVNPNGSEESESGRARRCAGMRSAIRAARRRRCSSSPRSRPTAAIRWMGSIAMDKQGNIALGYSVSSSTLKPAARYTGRLAGDALNTMQAEASIVEGGGSQTGSNLYALGRLQRDDGRSGR